LPETVTYKLCTMVHQSLIATAPRYLSNFYRAYISCRCSVWETLAICLSKWTDRATPQTVQCGLVCFQCRSPVGLEHFGRLCALHSTVLGVR